MIRDLASKLRNVTAAAGSLTYRDGLAKTVVVIIDDIVTHNLSAADPSAFTKALIAGP